MSEDRADWPHERSPFHRGELVAQARMGVEERIARSGRRMIRGMMPAEHRELFARLPTLVVGGLDGDGRVWASMLAGEPGFVSAPDPVTLDVKALPDAGDPLRTGLGVGSPVGLLGIEFHTRRRNRMNGTLQRCGADGFAVAVVQSFGNCPKYIQARVPIGVAAKGPWFETAEGASLSPPALGILSRADTLFIATASERPGSGEPSEGIDVSHRGGPPGFIQATTKAGRTHLVLPDYLGNFLFNSLGNVAVNPKVGLAVVDFETGDLLQLTGEASVSWVMPDQDEFPGAQRLLDVAVASGRLARGAIPLLWSGPELAPQFAAA